MNELIKIETKEVDSTTEKMAQLSLQFGELQKHIFAKMALKVGDKAYWEVWAKDIANIAEKQVERINRLIKDKGEHQKAFEEFLEGLRANINPSISQQEAIEMLSQHMITKPVFEALFENYSFVKNNPISLSMQKMIDLLEEQAIEKDTQTLEKFYDSVKKRAQGIDNVEGKQKIIIELYDKFFKSAFPKMVEKLGIVYTPVEAVDFILHSVNDILKEEFGRKLTDENVNIIDPFTGTGTFITRLLQSGLINKEDLERKYNKEIFANEIVLLAYYIAAINIENTYHDLLNNKSYEEFKGICLTDTFQLTEDNDIKIKGMNNFIENSERVNSQKNTPIQIIIGNPPYSIGQKSANDNAQNQKYPKLDRRIADTYAKETTSGLSKSLYDAYIKAFRWATDRLDKNGGIVAFISNGAWIDGGSTSVFRKCIEKEFSKIYVFNLRGNQRTNGELSKKEGGKIFGSGSRAPISITILVKNTEKNNDNKADIYYHDIGDYLSREEKLKILKEFKTIKEVKIPLKKIQPNEQGDWINHRSDMFESFIPINPIKKEITSSLSIFTTYSNGIVTSRDAWVYNFSKKILTQNIYNSVAFYNQQIDILSNSKIEFEDIDKILDKNPKNISWSRSLKNSLNKYEKKEFFKQDIVISHYRPFVKNNFYFNVDFNESPSSNNKLFKSNMENFAILISGIGNSKGFSILITKYVGDFQTLMNCLCFPLYYFEFPKKQNTLFGNTENNELVQKDGISDFILKECKKKYCKNISKEDIFYYVYGLLHNKEYRKSFENDLKKMLPRIPLVDTNDEFLAFSKAGRDLAELHLNYETVPAYEGVTVTGLDSNFFKVEKMRFPKKDQKNTILFNSKITIENIPDKAYEYIINGKSAIEWIIDRYQITQHKDSGIINDPNDWADEVGNPRYILDLLLSIINVSVQTVDIINELPKLKF